LIRIGRAPHNEIVIEQKGVAVSLPDQARRDRLLLEDVGSTNGTLVDGKQLEARTS
jgi:pSer/pThr/pTyr-binding forkhead associated (FHA) protein